MKQHKKPKLFTKVKCAAYLKKIRDGVHIVLLNPDGSFRWGNTVDSLDCKATAEKDGVVLKDLSDFDGDCVKKVYRERVEAEFTGVVVGYTSVKVSGLIGTIWEEPEYGQSYGCCFKQAVDVPKVAVVYFKNNCKRYVLLDDLEESKQ